MSHEQQPSQANQPSSRDEYATTSAVGKLRSNSTSNSAMSDSPMRSPHDSDRAEAPTRLQSWAARASDSQFNAIAGAIGGFTSGVVTCPLDVIKTKLQAQGGYTPVDLGRHAGHPKMYNGLVGTAKVIWRLEGLRGMYRGLGPIVMGYLPTWAVWFTVYNEAKIWIGQYQGKYFLESRVCTLNMLIRSY